MPASAPKRLFETRIPTPPCVTLGARNSVVFPVAIQCVDYCHALTRTCRFYGLENLRRSVAAGVYMRIESNRCQSAFRFFELAVHEQLADCHPAEPLVLG